MLHPLSHKYPIPISQLCLVNDDVPAGVGDPPLDTTSPKSKKDFLVLDMHNYTQQFQTLLEVKKKLQESFANHVLHDLENMQVGYFLRSGRAQK